ncbi:tandem-type lipoprotein, partial [Staphylococcus pasteuri]|uniref:tandem-type lipoprotein n=1 Tax=Staphylococcus pasteuri TaxID=45972 RepID=UPI000D3A0842
MNISKKWLLVIIIPLAIVLIIVGIWYSMKLKKENEIKDNFAKTLKMYPIKNLEDLYDKEGYRDEEFDKDDKGTWVVNSDVSITDKEGKLITEGMIVYINRNKKETYGHYYIRKIYKDEEGMGHNDETKIPIKIKKHGIEIDKNIKDKKLEKKIKDFKFFSQFADFNNLPNYKNGHIEYNPEVPNYSAEYQLSNNDSNVKKIREHFNIPTKKEPKLILKGDGDLKSSSIGNKSIEYT